MFFTTLTPTFSGYGVQIRTAGLVKTLSHFNELYLVITNSSENLLPLDIQNSCKKIVFIHEIAEDSEEKTSASEKLIQLYCFKKNIEKNLWHFYNEENLDKIFVSRLESYLYLKKSINLFPVKYIDLDELASENRSIILALKKSNSVSINSTPQQMIGLKMLEKVIISTFDKVFVSSSIEKDKILALCKNKGNIFILQNITPNLLYEPYYTKKRNPYLLFVGSFFYYPNEDAVHYFCENIFPRIQALYGGTISFYAVGFSPPESFKRLEKKAGVEIMGYQPSLKDFYARAAAVVVPLRAGTGTRLKILESFSHGCPVISTTIGASGLNITHEKNILIADDPEVFAQACVTLLRSPNLASQLVEQAWDFYQRYHSETALIQACYDAISS